MELIEGLNWRYATKKFDPDKKISQEELSTIKEAVRLSASSYGLQLYKVLIIEDRELRKKLRTVSWEQSQITDAAYLFVFCSYSKVKEEHIDEYLQLKSKVQNVDIASLADYGKMMKDTMAGLSKEVKTQWTARQTYIALGNLLAACSMLKIDACPMEGFKAEEYNEILGLNERGLNASVLATVGHRSVEDANQHQPKVRKSNEDLFEMI